ncbi:predicted protein [Nematostella vectensis]|uniref:Uncharacterized protein n=2 Tax=Nematostella vectensis TaxID=45351 RepID=A7SFR8_NEMVE|nr:predicted protein [Nematostella vectensis]|eukprot:XP_001629506.1 predicted protein [Nematostella vectensis]
MRMGGSPTECLLQDMRTKCRTVKQLVSYLELMEHSEALELLKPDEPPVITEQPMSLPVQEGLKLELTCRATGFPPPQYQWVKNGAELPYGCDSTLTIDRVSRQDQGKYFCIISNRIGSVKTYEVEVNVLRVQRHEQEEETPLPESSSLPYITQQPQSALIPIGHRYHLTCGTKGPVKFQWFKDGFRLHEGQRPNLHFPTFNFQDEGNYTCRVSNTAGNALSATATLQALPDQLDINAGQHPDVGRSMELSQTAADKVALVIGNRDYINLPEDGSPLVHSCSDAQRLASVLRKNSMNFKVVSMVNLTRVEMDKAINLFLDLLGENVYGLLYFAGHGFEEQGQNYMVPIDAERDWAPDEAVCVQKVFEMMHARGTQLNIFLLDICRKRAVTSQAYKMETYSFPFDAQLVTGYATCKGSDAYERKSDSNGIYMKHLLNNITLDVKVEDVLHRVAADVEDEVAMDEYTERQRPQYDSKTSSSFSLRDPVDPKLSPQEEREQRSGIWLELHRLPEKHVIEHRGCRVEVRFEHTNWLSNVIVVCLRVLELGETKICDASLSLRNLPQDFQDCHFHPSTTNILRQVVPREYQDEIRARTWKIDSSPEKEPAPVPVERISEIYNIQRLKKNLTLTIKLKYVLRGCEEPESKYEIKAFNIKEFGIAMAFC